MRVIDNELCCNIERHAIMYYQKDKYPKGKEEFLNPKDNLKIA